MTLPETVSWRNGALFLLDQTRLPLEEVMEEQTSAEQVWDSIKQLKVRGAPAIGVAAAYGLLVAVCELRNASPAAFLTGLRAQATYLADSRPTAVNLSWALDRMLRKAESLSNLAAAQMYDALVTQAQKIHAEDQALCQAMGEHGAPLIQDGMGVLTHCNAGALATSGIGTALAPMYIAQQQGRNFRVFADETRPLLQGARLTCWELQRSGIDVTAITDNMAAHMMASGEIDLVITGTDRVAANGDVANKIGTLGVAICAKHFGIPFYVALPSSTIDFSTPDGSGIPIEERSAEEVTHFGARRTAPENIQVRNPAFDVTPHDLVTGLITDRGLVLPPYATNLANLYEPADSSV